MRPKALTVGSGPTMKTYEEGIYFDMPFSEYLSLPCLSSSGLKKLLVSPTDFWFTSWLNPDKESYDKETAAKSDGRAYHKRILEGKKAFYDQYAPDYEEDKNAKMIRTGDEIKVALGQLGQSVTFKTVMEGALRLRNGDPTVRIKCLEEDAHRKKYAGKTFLSAATIRQIEMAGRMIELDPMINTFFLGGHPEVSVLWYDEDWDVWFKVRFDYLKVGPASDLKTFANMLEKKIEMAVRHAFWGRNYQIQAALYLMGNDIGKRFAAAGKVFGYTGDPKWLQKYSETECDRFNYVFQQKVIPVSIGGSLPKGGKGHLDGSSKVREAVDRFRTYHDRHGSDMWVTSMEPIIFDVDEKPIYTDHI